MTEVNQIKTNLARILAAENIHIHHQPGAETASFDVKNRILTLPVWQNISNDLYDMLIVHEVGHALDTPADGWVDAIKDIVKRIYNKSNTAAEMAVKDFLNVVEDARIDKRQKRRFPGSKRNYIVGLKELYAKNFFGIMGRDINQLGFIDRANLYFKGGSALLNIKFNDEERKFIRRMDETETFEEVMALTEEIFAWARKNGMEERELKTVRGLVITSGDLDEDEEALDMEEINPDDYDFIEFDDSDEDSDEDSDGNDGDQKGFKMKPSDSDEDSDEEGRGSSDEESDEEGEETESNSEISSGADANDDYIPQAETEKEARRNMSMLIQSDKVEFVRLKFPEFYYDKIVEDFSVVVPRFESQVKEGYERYGYFNNYSPTGGPDGVKRSLEKFQEWKLKERETISFMVKEFEMRKAATTYSRISISKTGILDPNKLHSYKFNDDVFRRVSSIPKGKNHGFVMFIDWSGSMEGNLQDTIKQLLSLTMFCRKMNIPFEVYYFRSAKILDFDPTANQNTYNPSRDYAGMDDWSKTQMSQNEGELIFGPFKVCNILSSRMNLTTFNKASAALWMAGDFRLRQDALWSTPLNQTILVAEKIVNKFRQDNKIEIVNTVFLTDGCSDNAMGYVKDRNRVNTLKKRVYILTDHMTKRSFNFEQNPSWHGRYLTNVFLQILKERTGSNTIGFFITDSSSMVGIARELGGKDDLNTEANQKFYKENNFLPVTTEGYDEYYVINSRKLSQTFNDTLNVDQKMTKGKMAKEFIRYTGKKAVNRVLLSSFIKRIASEDKEAA